MPESLHHDLRIHLHLQDSKLTGVDHVQIRTKDGTALTFSLSPRIVVSQLTIDKTPASFTLEAGELRVPLDPRYRDRLITATVYYEGTFDDPLPHPYSSMDNPGFGIIGTISPGGCFLQGGAGWYPEIPGSRPAFRLRVDAPEGIVAVTAGKSLGHHTDKGRTISRWVVREPSEGLSLSAGPYVVRQKAVGKVTAATYFFPETDPLAQDYLDATARYLTMYQDLFGPYAFEKFAVVENFFPTGYGFPSYTLLGSGVLRLPFIIRTSLGHEIAHCWWGNGVNVDYSTGNWCEGLTTYVADYLYREQSSPEDAKEHRLDILRNFATVTHSRKDFSLQRFRSRYDPMSKAIGYGKSAMVFHMLRTLIGEEPFWGGLRDIYRERLFQKTSWDDLQRGFEQRAGRSLETFFQQWISRTGAPRLTLRDVHAAVDENGWTVCGLILQEPPLYDLETKIRVESDTEAVVQTIRVSGEETPFSVQIQARPEMLSVDPDYHLFRHLYPSEVPPSINTLKSAPSVLVVLAGDEPEGSRETSTLLVRSLGLKNAQWIQEDRLTPERIRENHLLLVGRPRTRELHPQGRTEASPTGDGFVLHGKAYDHPMDVLFAVYPHPTEPRKTCSLFLPLSAHAARQVAGKITHYSKYSYLAFRNGKNVEKGTWIVSGSPLTYVWSGK